MHYSYLNRQLPNNVNNVLIENAEGYVYVGQCYNLKERTRTKRYNEESWQAEQHTPNTQISFKSSLAICLKRQVYNSCVLPATTYGSETWTLTKQAQTKRAAAQTNMERSKLNITCKDRTIWVRKSANVIDIISHVRTMKWSWARHINCLKDDRWTLSDTT